MSIYTSYPNDVKRDTQSLVREQIAERISPEPNTGCWLWMGISDLRYGRLHTRVREGVYRRLLAHRASYEAFKGPIPEGLTIDHICRVRLCVNPDHLEPVTQAENSRRWSVAIGGIRKTICKRGHPIAGDNAMPVRGRNPVCRECHNLNCRESARRCAARRKAEALS